MVTVLANITTPRIHPSTTLTTLTTNLFPLRPHAAPHIVLHCPAPRPTPHRDPGQRHEIAGTRNIIITNPQKAIDVAALTIRHPSSVRQEVDF